MAKKTVKKTETPIINWTYKNGKPDQFDTFLNDLRMVFKKLNNKKVINMHIDGNGSKYLHIYTTEPTLTIRIADHPTGAEQAVEVSSRHELIAVASKALLKIK